MSVQALASKPPRNAERTLTVAAMLVVDALLVGWVLFAESGRASEFSVRVVSSVLMLAPMGGFIADFAATRRPGPARLVPRENRLVAPRRRLDLLSSWGWLCWLAWPVASPETVFWSRDWTVLRVAGVSLAVLVVTSQLVSAVRGAGSVELDPSQIRLFYGLGAIGVPWDTVVGELVTTDKELPRLRVTAPEQVTARGLTGRLRRGDPPIPLRASVNRTFLASVIKYYVEHPEHRQEIGTQVGYDRLLRDIR